MRPSASLPCALLVARRKEAATAGVRSAAAPTPWAGASGSPAFPREHHQGNGYHWAPNPIVFRRIGDSYAAGMPIEPYVFVAGIVVALIAGAMPVLGIIESGPAALIGIIGIGLIALSASLRRRRS